MDAWLTKAFFIDNLYYYSAVYSIQFSHPLFFVSLKLTQKFHCFVKKKSGSEAGLKTIITDVKLKPEQVDPGGSGSSTPEVNTL